MSDSAYTFELAWRWTTPSHNVLPSGVMAQIAPLEEAAVPAGLTVRDWLNRGELTDIRSTSACDIEDTRRWLGELPVASTETIVIAWGRELLCKRLGECSRASGMISAIHHRTMSKSFRRQGNGFCSIIIGSCSSGGALSLADISN